MTRARTPSHLDVVMLSTGLSRGGAEHQLVQLAEGLVARGWRVGVVSMLPPAAFAERLAAAGIPVETLGMTRGVPDPRALVRLVRILRRWQPRVLHCHMVHANLLGRLVRLVHRVPVQISTAQNAVEGGPWVDRAYRLTDRLTDLTTNVSRTAVQRFVRTGAVPAERIRYIPNTADVVAYRPDAGERAEMRSALGIGDAFVWLAVGRFERQKDYPTMLRALARTADVQLLIAGQGELQAESESLAVSLGVAGRVSFLGLRDDVPALMNAVDGYVLSSAFEGLPLVLVEAAATALPIVTTDAGGAAEVLGGRDAPDGGIVVPVGDPDALGEAMAHLANLPAEARAAMGAANRARAVAQYSTKAGIDTWEAVYLSLLATGLVPD